MESEKSWYVIHTYSGYEKKVKDNLERKVKSMGLENVITRILVPEEDEIDIKGGQKRTVRRKIFRATSLSKWMSTIAPGTSSAIRRA